MVIFETIIREVATPKLNSDYSKELHILTGMETLQLFCRMFVMPKKNKMFVSSYLKWNNS